MTKSILSSCVHASHFKNVRMQESQAVANRIYSRTKDFADKLSKQRRYSRVYIYIYIKEKKDVAIFVHTNSNQKCLMPS